MDAILVPGGFGGRGTEGKIAAIRYARENKVPYLGICLGMQLATIEFARNKLPASKAPTAPSSTAPRRIPWSPLITEWMDREGRVESATPVPTWAAPCASAPRAARSRPAPGGTIYGKTVTERHRHRYEVNNTYVPRLEAAGMVISARTPTEDLPEMMELPHPCTLVRRRPVPPGIHLQSPRGATRCSPPMRAALAQHQAKGSMKLCGFRRRAGPALS